jgi:hypothetical protein
MLITLHFISTSNFFLGMRMQNTYKDLAVWVWEGEERIQMEQTNILIL